jgi:hypothetical protein
MSRQTSNNALPTTLSRVPTTSSFHARSALQRMATHETGDFADHEEESHTEGLASHEYKERGRTARSDESLTYTTGHIRLYRLDMRSFL